MTINVDSVLRVREVIGNAIEVTTSNAHELRFASPEGGWEFRLTTASDQFDQCYVEWRHGGRMLRIKTRSGRRASVWLRPVATEADPIIEVIQTSRIADLRLEFHLQGDRYHTHEQIRLRSGRCDDLNLRLGLFTQHGQIFDLRDWLLVENGDRCRGVIAIRPGSWSPGCFLAVRGTGSGCVVQSRGKTGPSRRSFLLVDAPVSRALVIGSGRHGDLREDAQQYAAWPASLIARYGFARPERVDIMATQAAQTGARPIDFAFGPLDRLKRAVEQSRGDSNLAAGWPLWRGNFDQARNDAISVLTAHLEGLLSGAYLHPCGNPVSARALAPALATTHLLDAMGHLTRKERDHVCILGSKLASLMLRRDYYPHHVAMICDNDPRSVQSIYRGMLNQNFNTDRYAFIGLAGCLLPNHPHAARWRRHAVDQFQQQMRSFVYPGGAWEESHSYAVHVMLTLLPLALALRHAPERVDLMSDPAFKAMCRFFPALLSPRADASGGVRAIPAIGDHGLDTGTGYVSHVFAWLAAMDADARPLHEWAWSECGAKQSNAKSSHIGTFAPLFAAMLHDVPAKPLLPTLPSVLELPGYGAAARCNAHTPHESLLVVRCGLSWAHYHNDQGSFWWWSRGRLICGDADLGRGSGLKHVHLGHNVLGYPGREPMQYLDRPQYVVDHVEQQDGVTRISCQLPVDAWQVASQRGEPIPPEHRPFVSREFEWRDAEQTLIVHDRPRRSPDGRVTWTIHVPATHARRIDDTTVEINVTDTSARLVVKMPHAPLSLALEPCGCTLRMTATYLEADLTHILTMSDATS